MDSPAFFLDNGAVIYWRAVIFAAGGVCFLLMLIGLRLMQGRKLLPVLAAVPPAVFLALLIGRFLHWHCLPESYPSFAAAMTDWRSGGFSLVGVFAAAVLTAWLLRLCRAEPDTPGLLDDLAAAGALGVAVGRLGEQFGSADRGKLLIENPLLHRLPYSAVVTHPISGAEEWRFAVFCAQSIWALCLFLLLTGRFFLRRRRTRTLGAETGKGFGFLLFLILYCEGQILLDSTRYDALFLRSNGFVSFEQILCCAVLTLILIVCGLRRRKTGVSRPRYLTAAAVYLGGFGLAGYMEYYVQRHGGAYMFAYGMMALGLAAVFIALCAAGAFRDAAPDDTEEKRSAPT